MPQPDLSFSQLQANIYQALKDWYEPGSETSPLSDLRLFQQNQRQNGASPRQATNQILLEALEELALTHQEGADLLDQLPAGTLFNVLDLAGQWAWGQVGDDGLVGYVPIAALAAE